MMDAILVQIVGVDLSLLLSGLSVLISLGVFAVYVLEYRQQKEQLAEQRRQIANQEKQLDAQQEQLAQQERQLETQERELEQYQEELEAIHRQTELAEMEHQPYLEVEDYQFDGDRVLLWVSNYGNGVATDLRLKTMLAVDGPDHIRPQPVASRLRRRDGRDNEPFEGQALRSGEQRVEFEGEAIVGMESPTGKLHQQSLRGVLMDLQGEEIGGHPELTLDVTADTLTDETHVATVTDQPIVLSLQTDGGPPNLATAASNDPRF